MSTSSRSASPARPLASRMPTPVTRIRRHGRRSTTSRHGTGDRACRQHGRQIINISDVTCMSARNIIDQRDLGAAVRYAAVDKNAVIVAAAGDSSKKDCKAEPVLRSLAAQGFSRLERRDHRGDAVLVQRLRLDRRRGGFPGTPMDKLSVAGPWVSIAAPGTDMIGLSPRDDSLINAIDGPDNTLLVPSGTSFSTAIVSGVAALVRAKYPATVVTPGHQPVDSHRPGTCSRGGQPNRLRGRRPGGRADLGRTRWLCPAERFGEAAALPPIPAPRNMTPVWVAAGGLGGALLLAGLVFGGAVLMRKTGRQE